MTTIETATELDLDTLDVMARAALAMAAEATPGEWMSKDGSMVTSQSTPADGLCDVLETLLVDGGWSQRRANGRFAASARVGWPAAEEAVLALTAEVRRLRALATPSSLGTLHLLLDDGTFRDVGRDEPCAVLGESVASSVLKMRHMTGQRVTTIYGDGRIESDGETLERMRR
jgi:hypothetical protein